jgi:hypothetical protein
LSLLTFSAMLTVIPERLKWLRLSGLRLMA